MSWIAYAILILAVAWALQIVGTYFQMRHYREVLGAITREGGEGFVGVGNAKATFGKGVILILVADENDTVKRALRMRGMTIFARFKEAPDLVGMWLDELRVGLSEGLGYAFDYDHVLNLRVHGDVRILGEVAGFARPRAAAEVENPVHPKAPHRGEVRPSVGMHRRNPVLVGGGHALLREAPGQ